MKIALNELRKMNQRYNTTGDIAPDGVDKLVEKIGAQLGGVDEVVDFGKKYQGIVVAKIVSVEKHSNADKLNTCKIDDGGTVKDIERDGKGLVQVVCAAPNVRNGMLVVWLPPGTTIPASVDKDPLTLEAKGFRGVMSNGMLASLNELAIEDDHSGILEVPSDKAKPGDDFAKIFGLDDFIIDIENKMFTHRPDLFGFLGVARELAGIQHMPFKSPDWYLQPSIPDIETEELKLEVRNELPELVPRFTAMAVRNVKVGPSPLWLQIFLAKMGQKSINNIVDYTNFFMFETSQPLHAYDYDKLKALSNGDACIVVRSPEKGEKIKLLNGKEIEPRREAIMIASDKQLIGIGGVMGGSHTEVDENTTNIIIECANFDMYSIRRTAMEHGLFTDAVTRFTKGQSPLQTKTVLAKIVDEIRTDTNGKVASRLIDINHVEKLFYELGAMATPDTISTDFINSRLGLNLSRKEMMTLLENVEFQVHEVDGDNFSYQPPFWRTDIKIPEDIVEEVGRLYGYDRLPLVLPKRNIVPMGPSDMLRMKQTVRETLTRFGANEVLTYSFVHSNLIESVGQNKDEAYAVSNALSPDLQYYRLSLTPSLLSQVHQNVKKGYNKFALFELGKTHNKAQENEDDVPKEIDTLSLVIINADTKRPSNTGSSFYQARVYLDRLAESIGVELVYYPVDRDPKLAMTAPFNLERSAFVTIKDSKGMLGIVGEYTKAVQESLKLPRFSSGFEIGINELLSQLKAKDAVHYHPLSRYPGTWQDVCFQVAPTITYKQLCQSVSQALTTLPLESRMQLVDIYQPETGEYKNITLRINLINTDHTITSDEANSAIGEIIRPVIQQLNAKII